MRDGKEKVRNQEMERASGNGKLKKIRRLRMGMKEKRSNWYIKRIRDTNKEDDSI